MKNLTYSCVILLFVSCYIDTSGDSKEWDKVELAMKMQ